MAVISKDFSDFFLVMCGDFNAKLDVYDPSINVEWNMDRKALELYNNYVVGKYLDKQVPNQNGELMVQMCVTNKLSIVSTCFDKNFGTHIHHGTGDKVITLSTIDYICQIYT